MAIINCDSAFNDKTHCDMCSEELKTPCWGWFGFNDVTIECDKEGETRHHNPFDLVMCLMCASKLAHNIVFDMEKAASDYKKAAEYIESIPTMYPASFVKTKPANN